MERKKGMNVNKTTHRLGKRDIKSKVSTSLFFSSYYCYFRYQYFKGLNWTCLTSAIDENVRVVLSTLPSDKDIDLMSQFRKCGVNISISLQTSILKVCRNISQSIASAFLIQR